MTLIWFPAFRAVGGRTAHCPESRKVPQNVYEAGFARFINVLRETLTILNGSLRRPVFYSFINELGLKIGRDQGEIIAVALLRFRVTKGPGADSLHPRPMVFGPGIPLKRVINPRAGRYRACPAR